MLKNSFRISLPTIDKSRMIDFFSDVLEAEVDYKTDVISYKNQLFILKPNLYLNSTKPINCVEFEFLNLSSDEILEIKQKFNFFIYRTANSIDLTILETLSEEINSDYHRVCLKDIDNRHWIFEATFPKDYYL